jgi:hypothetical protein
MILSQYELLTILILRAILMLYFHFFLTFQVDIFKNFLFGSLCITCHNLTHQNIIDYTCYFTALGINNKALHLFQVKIFFLSILFSDLCSFCSLLEIRDLIYTHTAQLKYNYLAFWKISRFITVFKCSYLIFLLIALLTSRFICHYYTQILSKHS